MDYDSLISAELLHCQFCSILTLEEFKRIHAVWLERVESWLNHVGISHVRWKESGVNVSRQSGVPCGREAQKSVVVLPSTGCWRGAF